MPGFNGTGPGGMGPMTGGGRGYCHPSGLRGMGVYRFPRWSPYAGQYRVRTQFSSGFSSYSPYMDREDEIKLLECQADILKKTLVGINERITELAGEDK